MKTIVEIEWDEPKIQEWLCADNISLALHAYCENTKFKVRDISHGLNEFGKENLALKLRNDKINYLEEKLLESKQALEICNETSSKRKHQLHALRSEIAKLKELK